MNRAYKLVWNTTQQAWTVASELAKGAKKSSVKALKLAALLAGGLGAATAWAVPSASELPSGESVVGNPVSFDRSVPNLLTVTQSNVAGIINWQSFNVGKDAKVIFNQPSSSSYVFNNVWGGSVSQIYGQIQSNGHFVINNPAGITFGAGSQVNASAIVASVANNTSTPNYSNHYSLNTPSGGTIQNDGSLTATAGSVTLLAGKIINSGSITATGGDVNLLNAHAVDFADSVPTVTTLSSLTGLIQNSGNITATQLSSVGGKILLTGDRSLAGSQIQLAGNLQADQTLVNGLSILVNGVLNINGNSHSLDLTADNGYQLSSASAINLNGASSGFSVDGTAYTVVRDVNQFQGISSNLSGQYVLATNIDASDTTGWNAGAGFAPLGDSTTPFSGTLDGLGHAVSNLFINRGSADNVGLFGYAQNASLRNIGLTSASIIGQSNVGGLLGYLNTSLAGSSSIQNSYVSGNIIATSNGGGLLGNNNNAGGTVNLNLNYSLGAVGGGSSLGGLIGYSLTTDGGNTLVSNSYSASNVAATGSNAGGLMGWNYTTNTGSVATSSVVSNSYATGSVYAPGGARVGGLVGVNLASNSAFSTATVSDSYASGAVTGSSSVGGLIGINSDYASASNSYWDADTTGQANGIGADNAVSSNIVRVYGNTGPNSSAYAKAGYANLDFNNDWFIADTAGRPMLRAFLNTLDVSGKVGVGSLYQLEGINANLSGSYYLTRDIDASATAASVTAGNNGNRADVWSGKGFAPIGNTPAFFSGMLDGRNHTVDGLNIKRSDLTGLIGYGRNVTVQDIGLTNLNISGRQTVGGLIGIVMLGDGGSSSVKNVYTTGTVSASTLFAGGLIGAVCNEGCVATTGSYNFDLSGSYSSATVTAAQGYAGGLVGSVYGKGNYSINHSYFAGSVSGSQYIGGIVGTSNYMAGQVLSLNQVYASGPVSASVGSVGGLVGDALADTSISNSYWNTESTGQASATGNNLATQTQVIGLTNAQSKQLASYANWGSDIDAQGGTGSIWRIYEGQTAPLLRSFLKAVDVNVGNASKTYDSTAYHVTGGSYTLSDPAASLLGSISYGPGTAEGARNAGSYSLTADGLYSTQQGYDIRYVDGTLTVNKAALGITSTSATKTYDGTTSANASTVISSGSLFGTDSISGGSFAFADKNAGTGKHVIVSGVTVNDGNNGGNYDVTYVDNTSSTINKRLLTISAVADSKEYDGRSWSTAAPLVTGRVRGDSIAGLTQSFANKNAGTGKTINVDGSYVIRDGNNGNNYDVVVLANSNGVITPKALTISTVANTKVYDGGVTSASKPVVSGLISGDRVTGLFQQYETKTVGTGKKLLIKSGYVVQDGNGGGNYSVVQQTSTEGVITAH